MANTIEEFTTSEGLFFDKLLSKGDLVEVSYDLLTVTINGTIVGTFEGQKAIYSQDWTDAQNAVTKSNTKLSGLVYNSVVCSATADDLLSVVCTESMMKAILGQTNVPIDFTNGNRLILADDTDLAAFLAVWQPFRVTNSIGYTFKSEY